tara:strand:- start:4773 stop:5651 length:879 start_codon:yes stop_codon:yes gene_type:complete
MVKRVLLTGGGGFSGSYYAESLAAAGFNLIVHAGRSRGRLPDDFEVRTGAKVITGELDELQIESPLDIIIHAGACSYAPGVTFNHMTRANILGTQNIAKIANQNSVKNVIYFSSLSVYGKVDGSYVNELTSFFDPDFYGVSKYIGELALQNPVNEFSSISIRLPGVLGSGAVRNFLANVKNKARIGEPISFFGAKNLFNNAVHVSDLSKFLIKLLDENISGHDTIVVGATEKITVGEAVASINETCGSRSAILPEDNTSQPVFLIDDERAREVYSYESMNIRSMIITFAKEE